MANVKNVKRWFLVHKWTSLICTLFPLMLCLTGLPLVFYEEIEDLQGKAQAAPPMPEGTPHASLDDIIRVGQQQRPHDVVRYVYWDDEQPQSLGMAAGNGGTNHFRAADRANGHRCMALAFLNSVKCAGGYDDRFLFRKSSGKE